MDLCEQLARVINRMDDMPTQLKVAHLSKDIDFGIYALPGSRVISQDYAGNQEKQMPIEISYRSHDEEMIETTLYRVATLLDELTALETDGTYTVDAIDVQPQPFMAGVGINDMPTYVMMFTVDIMTKKKLEK